MGSFSKYKTRAAANEGAVLNLKGLDGKETGDWIKVRGVDSDEFQLANRVLKRNLLDHLEGKLPEYRRTAEYMKFTDAQQVELQASLVMAWSFDEPCDRKHIVELFTDAPGVAEQVDLFAGKRERFVGSSSTPSEPTQNSSSDSTCQ